MNYKKQIKKMFGAKMQRRLSYVYHVFRRDFSMSYAIKKLSGNKRFNNIHQGERCFILGNGPSLKEVPLECLKDEQVFTVNYFSKIPNYRIAKTNYHIWMDSLFFNLRNDIHADMKEVMECYNLISKEKCECFFPTCAYGFLKEHELLEKMKPNYIYNSGELQSNSKLELDICEAISSYTTVVQYAITIAIYMGFSEIYLLGCDSSYIVGIFSKLLEVKNDTLHAYDNDNAGKEIEEMLEHHSMSEMLYDQYLMFLGYERLYEYCKEKKIALFNCSKQTAVTSIPRISLGKVLYGK